MEFHFNKSFGSNRNNGNFGSNDTYTETTYTSYGESIGDSFKGIFVGMILLVVSIGLLWWNEGRSVDQADALNEMQEKIVTLPNTEYNAQYDNQPVLVHGMVKPLHKVIDPEFGIQSDGLVLRKTVQMYQWKERKESQSQDKLGGGTETVTTYTYSKEWSSTYNDSTLFKQQAGHQNPLMMHKGATYSTDAQMGDFHLDAHVVRRVGASTPYPGLADMPYYIGDAKNYRSFLYLGMDPDIPQIGDYKITYTYAPAGVYTFAAKQSGRSLMGYTTDNGKELLFARSGTVSAESIFKEELEFNALLTWILRGVGLVMMYIALSMMMGIIATFAKVVPIFGSLIGGVTGLIAGALTLLLGSLVIALAWFSSRPLLSLIIIGVGVSVAFVLGKLGKKSKQASSQRASYTPPTGDEPTPPKQEESDGDQSTTPPPRGGSTPPPRDV